MNDESVLLDCDEERDVSSEFSTSLSRTQRAKNILNIVVVVFRAEEEEEKNASQNRTNRTARASLFKRRALLFSLEARRHKKTFVVAREYIF